MKNEPLSPFWSSFFRKDNRYSEQIVRLWADTILFQGIKKKEIRKLCKNMHLRKFSVNEPIFSQGDTGVGVILVYQGEVEIRNNNHVLATLIRGDFFGEVALITDDTRTADAVSIKNSELCYFLKQDLEEWMEHSPVIAARFLLNLSKVLATRLRHANQQLSNQTPC